ncbi:LysR family transcriptional regulator [Noviherbaspirillum cavernae]|uniref:LysR family transcriptional regulator n=1 Tax=Noviherbaspirillum cavernae TaxID=2320862 RepID=A0A418WX00_9BURK|nr:LysR family transcriptional regulator [Noviherbaspirillum cavernae]RJG04721.1 LysR family transcriptional regulator [Noviherbaspirillum cavernae]
MKSSYAKTQSTLALGDLELLLALVRGRTLGGAAERLKLDASTVFRSIKRIEKDVGEVLFDRGRQGYMPTDLALELAGYAERIEAQLQDAREAAFKSSGEPSGKLRITTTDTILHGLLLPVMSRFAVMHPRIELELITSNALANLSQRDADVAIRATRKPPEHLVGTRLGTMQAAVFASRSYVERSAAPLRLDEADWIALDETLADHPSVKWRRQRFPKLVTRYRCNSVLSVAGSVVWGLGVGVVPLFLMQHQRDVQIVEGPVPELETELWALAHPDIRHLQRVKLLFDFLKENVTL